MLCDLGLMNQINVCIEVGEKAGREWDIEKTMIKMKSEWDEINFSM